MVRRKRGGYRWLMKKRQAEEMTLDHVLAEYEHG